jgi:hypothetical protein
MNLSSLVQSIFSLADRAVIHISQLHSDWRHNAFAYPLLALVAGFVIGRYRAYSVVKFQNRGEALLARVMKANFGPPDYHLMNHVTLQMKDGTTQIDHILVSRFGVFVIETKEYKGWIFGDSSQAKWTQVLFNAKYRFQNPIQQNFRHVSVVQELLDFLPPDAVRSAVVFVGDAEFKTVPPQGVFCDLSEFINYIRGQNVEIMSVNRVQFCVGRLETSRLAVSGKTDIEHIESLARRHGNFN